jgi:hypothetical protein
MGIAIEGLGSVAVAAQHGVHGEGKELARVSLGLRNDALRNLRAELLPRSGSEDCEGVVRTQRLQVDDLFKEAVGRRFEVIGAARLVTGNEPYERKRPEFVARSAKQTVGGIRPRFVDDDDLSAARGLSSLLELGA